jgi:hypothetical protein
MSKLRWRPNIFTPGGTAKLGSCRVNVDRFEGRWEWRLWKHDAFARQGTARTQGGAKRAAIAALKRCSSASR